jgi:hypothetical protein
MRERRVLKKKQRRDLRRNKERRTLLTEETHRGKEELQQLASTPHRRPPQQLHWSATAGSLPPSSFPAATPLKKKEPAPLHKRKNSSRHCPPP